MRIVFAGISESERKLRNESNKWATQVNFAAWAIEVFSFFLLDIFLSVAYKIVVENVLDL